MKVEMLREGMTTFMTYAKVKEVNVAERMYHMLLEDGTIHRFPVKRIVWVRELPDATD